MPPKINKNIPISNLSSDKSIRDLARKSLLKDFDCQETNLDQNTILFDSEKLSILIEDEVNFFIISHFRCTN